MAEKLVNIFKPLVLALKAGIQQRFADVFTSDNAKLAAVVTPKFKLDWIEHDFTSLRKLA